jgi:hypothetical protein
VERVWLGEVVKAVEAAINLGTSVVGATLREVGLESRRTTANI